MIGFNFSSFLKFTNSFKAMVPLCLMLVPILVGGAVIHATSKVLVVSIEWYIVRCLPFSLLMIYKAMGRCLLHYGSLVSSDFHVCLHMCSDVSDAQLSNTVIHTYIIKVALFNFVGPPKFSLQFHINRRFNH